MVVNFVAQDGYLPNWLTKRGHRLNFSNGILVLTAAAMILILVTRASVEDLVAYYALGVFTAFTLSGLGMAKYAKTHFIPLGAFFLDPNFLLIAQIWHVQADRREQVEKAEAGDIVGVIGPRGSITGDTLCDANEPILLETIQFPETVISMAIEPETSLDRKKLAETLEMMKRQDPTFRALESEETGQTLISGMGELHLEVIRHRLERDFNLKCRVHKPRVSYKETIGRPVEVAGSINRQVAGQTLAATVTLRAEPVAEQGGVTVEQGWFPEGDSLASLAALMTQSVRESAERGGLKGC